jgi:glycosyltransferase involved in cell wall biosynthesis
MKGDHETQADAHPLVSIITVVLNGASTIEKTIQSVISQDYNNIEYIIIDGRSTDGTIDIINKYRSRIDVCISEADRGISDAFNKGIRRSTGEYILILNSDDALTAGAISRSIELFRQYPDIGFTFGHCAQIKNGKIDWINYGDINYGRSLKRRMTDVNHPTIMVRKSVYDSFGLYNTSYRYAMDYDFLLRIHGSNITGKLVDEIQTTMSLDGISDRYWYRACREVRDISREHGYPGFKAHCCYLFYIVRGWTRRRMVAIGLNAIVFRLRRSSQKRHVKR